MAEKASGSPCNCNQNQSDCACLDLACQNFTRALNLRQENLIILGEEDFWSHPSSGLFYKFQSFSKLVRVCARIFQFVEAVKKVQTRAPKLHLRSHLRSTNYQAPQPAQLTQEDLEHSRQFLLVKLWLRD